MKEIRYLLIMAICAIGLAACQDEDLAGIGQGVNTDKPVKVELKFEVPKSKQVEVTRAGKDGDNVVQDLYIFIFNSEGNLKTAHKDNESFADKKSYSITTTSGLSYIYAVANVANAPAEYNADNLKETLDAAVSRTVDAGGNPFTKDELMKLTVSYRNANVGIIDRLQSSFMMSGKFVPNSGDQGDGQCTIPEDGNLNGEIKLYRTDAEVIFNVSIGNEVDKPADATITPSFELTSYRIVNLPRKTSVINNSSDWDNADANTDPTEENYYEIAAADAQNDWDDQADGSQQFTFYMMENRKNAKEKTEAMTDYADRERQEKQSNGDGSVTNGDWTYAPERGTYVVIRGIFRGYAHENGTSGDLVPVEGREVQYKIHLGDFRNKDWDNFQTNRNTSYTYNVKVNGVDNIVVEVVTDTENQPGATGDIFFTNNTNIYELDAHYETCLLTFTKSMLAGIQGAEPTYRVSTPFSKSNEEDYLTYKSQDANWVRFAINARSEYGEKNYSRNLRSYQEGCASNGLAGEGTYNEGDLLTVDQLMAVLGDLRDDDDSRWDNNGRFLVTCFVNEFYYTNDTEELGYEADSNNGSQYAPPIGANVQAGVPLWKYCVNQPARTLHLLCDIRSSADGESNIIEAAYVLSQRSIQTYYNTDPSVTTLTSCLGLETVNETGSLDMGSPNNHPRDYRDGLTNTLRMWNFVNNMGDWSVNNASWDTYINFANNGYTRVTDEDYAGMRDNYKQAYMACMQRNRDVDRDGRITEDEIKWYMPAINEMASIYIGESALSPESRLMPNNSSWVITHYYSSTYAGNNEGDILTVWAEEGFSTSTQSQTDSWGDLPDYHYRCVRNVGNINLSRDEQTYLQDTRRPQNYWNQSADGYTIDFTYLSSEAVRSTATTSELSIHDQFDVQNRVYRKMQYAKEDADDQVNAITAANTPSPEICADYSQNGDGTGWRIPNQRELMFLALNGQNQNSGVTGLIRGFPTLEDGAYHGYNARTHFRWWTPSSTSAQYPSPFDRGIRYSFFVVGGAKGSGNSGNLSLHTNNYNNNNWSYNWTGTNNYIRCVRDVVE